MNQCDVVMVEISDLFRFGKIDGRNRDRPSYAMGITPIYNGQSIDCLPQYEELGTPRAVAMKRKLILFFSLSKIIHSEPLAIMRTNHHYNFGASESIDGRFLG
jgi:hypothetical protein